jgi:HEPN domain-containing protein
MRNDELGQNRVRDAEIILEQARSLSEREVHHLVVRRCQESVELSLKGLLYFLGIDYPKKHDVGLVVEKILSKKGVGTSQERERLRKISKDLANDRELAFYGSDAGEPPSLLFSEKDAQKALEDAQYVLSFVKNVLR